MFTASKFLVIRIQNEFLSRTKKNWCTFPESKYWLAKSVFHYSKWNVLRSTIQTNWKKHLSRKQYLGMPAQCVWILFSLKISQTINGVFEMRSMWIDYLFLFCERFCIGLEWSEAILTFRPYTQYSSLKIMLEFDLCHNNWTRNQT